MAKSTIPWGPIAIGGCALLIFANMGNKVKLPGLTDEDVELLNTKPDELKPLIQNDTSAVIFTVQGTTMTDAERAEALNKVYQYFSAEVDKLSARLMVDKNILTNAITACMAISDGDVRENSLKLFFRMFDAWTTLFVNTVLAAGSGIAEITESTTNAVLNAKTCATWTFVKETEQYVDQTSTTVNSVKYTASSNKIVLGLLGSGSSQSSFHQSINTTTMSEKLVTRFVPTCTSQVIDPDAVFAIMATHVISLKPLYDMVQLAADLAPKIENFVTTTP